jgi:hypothetical protein
MGTLVDMLSTSTVGACGKFRDTNLHREMHVEDSRMLSWALPKF